MSGIPIPTPNLDDPIHSVAYYKNNYNVDLLSKNHEMQEEISHSHKVTDFVNKHFYFTLDGKPVKSPYNDAHYRNSKKIGSNEYQVSATQLKPMEKQLRKDYCWAASINYFLSREYGRSLSQQTIVDAIKKGLSTDDDKSASVMEMLSVLGLGGLRYTPNGSQHLIEALGRNHIAIIGLKDSTSAIGHAVVVVGAKYSFVNNLIPYAKPQYHVAYSELTILDPFEGKMLVKRAEEIESNIEFVLTQDPIAIDLKRTQKNEPLINVKDGKLRIPEVKFVKNKMNWAEFIGIGN